MLRMVHGELVEPLIVFGEFFQFIITADRTILTYIEMANITSAPFPNATFHPFL